MKKLFILFSIVICMFLGSVNVFAADDSNIENSGSNVTITFKVGNTNYTVNDKNVKAEASALVKGKTFVPVNVITDALNATLKVDLKAKTAIITYNDVQIKLTEKKQEAIIAGKTVKIDSAPYIKNNSFMASITFLADTLGADITYAGGKITFIKEIVNPNSIKDFGSLIKKTTKSKVGDSYHKWSMLLPDDLKLSYRDFIGTTNEFDAQDGSYYISLYISDRGEDQDLEDSANSIMEYVEDYTLIDYSTQEENGVEFVEFVYKDDTWTYQERIYLSATKEYDIFLFTKNEDSYLDDKYQNILNSFQCNFKKDGSTEDLSDVTAGGYRKYQDTRLKWSINLPADWREYKDSAIQNRVVFNGNNKKVLAVDVYSLEKGETLDSITNDATKEDIEYLNNELFKVTKQESAVIGGVKCNKVYYTIEYTTGTYYGWDIYFVDKNYKYILNCEISEKDYKISKQKKLVDGMINSFKFTELNTKKIGKLLDPEKIVIANKTKKVTEDLFTFEVPFSWKKDTDTSESIIYYDSSINVEVSEYEFNSLYEFINSLDVQLNKLSGDDFKIESKTTVNDKGTTCYKYIAVYDQDGIEVREIMYVLENKGKIISVDLNVDNLYYGTKNQEILNKIWESFTLK